MTRAPRISIDPYQQHAGNRLRHTSSLDGSRHADTFRDENHNWSQKTGAPRSAEVLAPPLAGPAGLLRLEYLTA